MSNIIYTEHSLFIFLKFFKITITNSLSYADDKTRKKKHLQFDCDLQFFEIVVVAIILFK